MKKSTMLASMCLIAISFSSALANNNSYHEEKRYGREYLLHPASHLAKGNFYVTAAAGTRMGRYEQFTPDLDTYHEGFSGPLGILAAGYDRLIFDKFLLGFEFFTAFSHATHNENHYTTTTVDWNHSVKTPLAYGIALTPGYRLDNSDIFYLKPTYQLTEYSRQTTPSTTETVGPTTTATMHGLGLGLGYARMISPHTSMRLEFNHVNYQQIKTPSIDWEHNLQENIFTVGVSHHFYRFNASPEREVAPALNLGIYAGAGLGLSAYRGDMLYTLTLDNAKQYHIINGENGLVGSAQLGYGNIFDVRTYLAFELQTTYNTAKSHEVIGGDNTISMSEKEGVQLSVLPGYMMNNHSLIMGQVGMNFTVFERPAPVLTDTASGPRGDQGPEFSKWKSGLVLGLGYQTAISESLSIRGLYSHRFYERIRNTEYDADGLEEKYYDWLMQSAHFTVSLNYLIA